MANKWLREGQLAVLDIGSTKVCCAVARTPNNDSDLFEVIGYGKCACKGVKSGFITDIDTVENAIISAVDSAEHSSREPINSVVVSVSNSKVQANIYTASIEIQGEVITQQDILRIIARARPDIRSDGYEIIHAIPIEYIIDGNAGITEPIGMVGRQLGVRLHVISVPKLALNNLLLSVSRCHIKVKGFFLEPYAAAAAVVNEQDITNGVTVIVFGGGTTSLATFYSGALVHIEILPIGSVNVTNDLSYGLRSSYENAERLKTLYGSVVSTLGDSKDMILAPLNEDDDLTLQQVPRSELVKIIIPRIEEILEELKNRFSMKPYLEAITRKIILTGGGSQLSGLKDFVASKFNKPVSLGIVDRIKAFSAVLDIKPDFSTAAGLIMFAHSKSKDSDIGEEEIGQSKPKPDGFWQAISNWLVKNL